MRNPPYRKSLRLLYVPSLFDTHSAYILSFMCIFLHAETPRGLRLTYLRLQKCNPTEKHTCVYVCARCRAHVSLYSVCVCVCEGVSMQQKENVDE